MKTAFSRRLIATMALSLGILTAIGGQSLKLQAQAPSTAPVPATGVRFSQISQDDMKEWLSYLASDELQGRQVFTEGYGRATQYVADHLKTWGLKPLGADGTYFQPVKLKAYKVTRNSTVSVEAGGQSRTFKHGDHVTFAANSGGRQALSFTGVEFVGYGLPADYERLDLKGKLIVSVPNLVPAAPAGVNAGGNAGVPPPPAGGARGARGGPAGGLAAGAIAAITFAPAPAQPSQAEQALTQALNALNQANAAVTQAQQALRGRGGAGGGRGGNQAAGARGAQTVDLTTVQRVDGIVAPSFSGDETFFETLFADSPVKFADIRSRAGKGEAIQPFSLPAKVTINIDNTFDVLSEQITHNVVGMVEGTDPALKETYVMFGAHLDHIGYSQNGTGRGGGPDACRRRSVEAQAAIVAAGKVVQRPTPARGGAGGGRGAAPAGVQGQRGPATPAEPLDQRDLVSNGADDDGSGSTALLSLAKAFATGPKPKRSVVLVWHAGEEAGLYGSRYNADFPVVPLEKVQAQLNMDMIGRDDCDNIEGDFSNTLFIVGADRISTDLHNLIVQTNTTLTAPLTLDYELNDANDPEGVYTRSDHYSYASKGIPIAFFTTGLHPDYHRITDTVDKIKFPKMARIAQLVYQTGFAIANTDRVLQRDNKGPRTGFGSKVEALAR